MEMPGFEKLYAERKGEGFLILAINEDEKPADLDAYLKKKPVTFPVLSDVAERSPRNSGSGRFPRRCWSTATAES